MDLQDDDCLMWMWIGFLILLRTPSCLDRPDQSKNKMFCVLIDVSKFALISYEKSSNNTRDRKKITRRERERERDQEPTVVFLTSYELWLQCVYKRERVVIKTFL